MKLNNNLGKNIKHKYTNSGNQTMTEADIMNFYRKLSELSAELLASPHLIKGDVAQLEKDFMESFCKVLQASLELNVTPTDIKEFHKQTNGSPKDIEIFEFISDKIETPRSYILINYFLATFIISFIKNAKPGKQRQILH